MFGSEYLYRPTHATENFSARSEICTFDLDLTRNEWLFTARLPLFVVVTRSQCHSWCLAAQNGVWAQNGGAFCPVWHSIPFLFREGAATVRIVKSDNCPPSRFLRFTVIRGLPCMMTRGRPGRVALEKKV